MRPAFARRAGGSKNLSGTNFHERSEPEGRMVRIANPLINGLSLVLSVGAFDVTSLRSLLLEIQKMENVITYTATRNMTDLEGVLALQKANLKKNLSKEEIEADGFVTVEHNWATLERMAEIEPQIVAKHNDKVVGYVLAMTKESRFDIPVIFPMFAEFEKIIYKGRIVADYDYMVVGQACIHKDYRGTGIIENCFRRYKDTFAERYDFSITEIATSNLRSVKAHKKAGFEEIHTYKDADQDEWVIVIWDWKS